MLPDAAKTSPSFRIAIKPTGDRTDNDGFLEAINVDDDRRGIGCRTTAFCVKATKTRQSGYGPFIATPKLATAANSSPHRLRWRSLYRWR